MNPPDSRGGYYFFTTLYLPFPVSTVTEWIHSIASSDSFMTQVFDPTQSLPICSSSSKLNSKQIKPSEERTYACAVNLHHSLIRPVCTSEAKLLTCSAAGAEGHMLSDCSRP
jgi:hypothetical protein